MHLASSTASPNVLPMVAGGGSGGRSQRSRVGLVIKVNATQNPKKRGAAERFSKYRDGMTPNEYAQAIGGDPNQAYRDIVWDSENGYIELVRGEGK